MKDLEFPAQINVGLAVPNDTTDDNPFLTCITMRVDRLPFTFIVDSPDPEFIDKIVEALQECATQMRGNPKNEAYFGTHATQRPGEATIDVEATEVDTAEAASNDTGPAPGESE